MANEDLIIEPDLLIVNGDIAISDSDETNSLYITFANKGQIRVNPLLGVGILKFTNAPTNAGRDLAKAVREEHNRDGYKVKDLNIEEGASGSQELTLNVVKIRN